MNERDGAVMDANINDPVAATDPRQDDYDIWLGTVTLDKWIPWNRHGTLKRALPGRPRQVGAEARRLPGHVPWGSDPHRPQLVSLRFLHNLCI